MNRVSVDVLSNIVERLPLYQKFQLLTVNKRFEEASKLALAKHQSLTSILQIHSKPFYRLECNMGGHIVRMYSNFIHPDWFSYEETETAKYILSHLPGLKVAFFDGITEETMEHLHTVCPKLQCFSTQRSEHAKFYRNPNLYHFEAKLDGDVIAQLNECYPCLTGIKVWGDDKVQLQSSFFREGIRNLNLKFFHTNFDAVFSSAAMKTVEEIKLAIIDTVTKTDLKFSATNLKEISIETWLSDQPVLSELCTSLANSLAYSPELRDFSFTSTYHSTVTWEMPIIMFQSMTKLVKICLPQHLQNTDEVLEIICSQNPHLEEISVGNVCGSKKKKILDLIQSVPDLKSLTINNESISGDEAGLSPEELDEFVDRITVNGKLKYPFTLIQCEDFPEDLAEEQDRWMQVDWKGVHWFMTKD